MRLLILSLILILTLSLSAQENLIVNPGFEQLDKEWPSCQYTKHASQFNGRVRSWTTFNSVTPDLIVWNDSLQNDCPYPQPLEGNKMAGFIAYHPAEDSGYGFDYHEYLQGKLRAPLEVGKQYQMQFWLQQDDSVAVHHLRTVLSGKSTIIPVACNNISVGFLVNPAFPDVNIRQQIEWRQLRSDFKIEEVVTTRPGEWKAYSFTFTAKRPYQYFIIGNFNSDDYVLTKSSVDLDSIRTHNERRPGFYQKVKRIAYYCVDQFYLGPAEQPLPELSMESSLRAAGGFTFRELQFASGSSVIQTASFPELDRLLLYLQANSKVRIVIEGHTDSVGSDAGQPAVVCRSCPVLSINTCLSAALLLSVSASRVLANPSPFRPTKPGRSRTESAGGGAVGVRNRVAFY
jgi:hypothetical protein